MTDELQFFEEGHRYVVAGEEIPSVTTVLSAQGIGADFTMVDEATLEFAKNRGVAVHAAVQFLLEDRLDWSTVDERIVPYLQAFERFRKATGFEPIEVEQPLFDPGLRIAGTPDMWGWMGNRRVVVDLKATAALHPGNRIQVAGYQRMIHVARKQRIDGRYLLQLRKDGRPNLVECKDPIEPHVFVAAVSAHHGRADDNALKMIQHWIERSH